MSTTFPTSRQQFRIISFLSLILLFTAFSHFSTQAQGIDFHKGDWASALAAAKAQDKLIFMDCYTDWCGPCKMMSRDVFPKEQVGAFFNKNFINVKMNMEKGEGRKLAQQYGVRAYPTLLFIDGEGKVVHTDKGAKPVDRFLMLGKTALKKFDKSIEYEKEYANGERSAAFLKKYAYALQRAKKPYIKIANEYLQTIEQPADYKSSDNLKFIFDMVETVDSRLFSLLVKYRSDMLALDNYDKDDFEHKVVKVAEKTIVKAVEFSSEDLLAEAKTAVKSHAKDSYKEFVLRADVTYYSATKDEVKFIKAISKYVKKFAKNNAVKLNEAAELVLKVCESPSSFKKAEKWAAKAVKNGGQARYYLTHTKVLIQLNEKQKALKVAKAGRQIAKDNKKPTTDFDNIINDLKA